MIVIIEFQIKFFCERRMRDYCILSRYKNNIHDLLVMFEKQDTPTKTTKKK